MVILTQVILTLLVIFGVLVVSDKFLETTAPLTEKGEKIKHWIGVTGGIVSLITLVLIVVLALFLVWFL